MKKVSQQGVVMVSRGQRFWWGLVGLSLLAAGCLGDANMDGTSQRFLLIEVDDYIDAIDAGYDGRAPNFEVSFSEADAEALGASGTRFGREEGRYDFVVGTKFEWLAADAPDDLGPCLVDDVVITNLDTGEEFVVIEAGQCIADEWLYEVEGAHDYLIDAGPCTGAVVLADGRELAVECK